MPEICFVRGPCSWEAWHLCTWPLI